MGKVFAVSLVLPVSLVSLGHRDTNTEMQHKERIETDMLPWRNCRCLHHHYFAKVLRKSHKLFGSNDGRGRGDLEWKRQRHCKICPAAFPVRMLQGLSFFWNLNPVNFQTWLLFCQFSYPIKFCSVLVSFQRVILLTAWQACFLISFQHWVGKNKKQDEIEQRYVMFFFLFQILSYWTSFLPLWEDYWGMAGILYLC